MNKEPANLILETYTESLIGKRFIYDNELEWLYKTVIIDDSSLVGINGLPGVGKTALAKSFTYKYEELFPGGIVYMHAYRAASLLETARKSFADFQKASLIIIDDADYSESLDREVSAMLKILPKSKIILVSRTKLKLTCPKLELKLNLNNFNMLINQFPINTTLTQEVISDLYKITKGNLVSVEALASLLKERQIDNSQIMDLFKPFETPGIIGLDGKPLSVGSDSHKQITTEVSFVSNELLNTLHKNPGEFYSLTPRKFEEVVAEILNRLGYEVSLTSQSRDGGKDIYAAKKDALGSFLYVVECKKYAPTNLVGIGVIQRLHGVVQAEKATAGIVATTSYFTKYSKRFQENISHQMSLQDYFGIINWLKQIKGN